MAGTAYSGRHGRVVISGLANLNANKWTATATAVDLETTNYESTSTLAFGAGNTMLYEEGAIGKLTLEFELSAFLAQEDISPPRISFGQLIGPVYLYISRSQGIGIWLPVARCLSVPVMSDVQGKVEYSIRGKNHGVFFLPGQPSGKNTLPKAP